MISTAVAYLQRTGICNHPTTVRSAGFNESWPIYDDSLPARFEKSLLTYPGVPASPSEPGLPTTTN